MLVPLFRFHVLSAELLRLISGLGMVKSPDCQQTYETPLPRVLSLNDLDGPQTAPVGRATRFLQRCSPLRRRDPVLFVDVTFHAARCLAYDKDSVIAE